MLLVPLVLSSCAGGSTGGTEATMPTSVTAPPAASSGVAVDPRLSWQPCGQVECGTLTVPVREWDDSTLRVAAYRRSPTVGPPVGTLVLLPDWEGLTARDLAEKAPIVVGPAAHQFTVIAVSPRGFYDSSPLPCGAAFAHFATPEEAAPFAAACWASFLHWAPCWALAAGAAAPLARRATCSTPPRPRPQ